MAQINITFNISDTNLAEKIADAKLIHPEIGTESNSAYVKRVTKDFWSDVIKEGQIIRLKASVAGQLTDPEITVS